MRSKPFTIAYWELAMYEGEQNARCVAANPAVMPWLHNKEKIDPYLHDAARDGNLGQVKAAVENLGFNVNKRDHINETPLHKVVRCGKNDPLPTADYVGVTQYLLDKMVADTEDPEDLAGNLGSALFLAIHFASLEIVQMLLSSGATVIFTEKALFMASERATKLPELLPILMQSLKPKKSDMSSALGIAIDLDRSAAIQVLLDAGANPSICGEHILGDNMSPLQIAARRNDTELLQLLAKYST